MAAATGSGVLKLAILMIVAGAVLAAIGLQVGGPFVGGAVAAFGAAATLGGVHSIVTRRHRSGTGHLRSDIARSHSGPAAVLFGLAFLIPGVAMLAGGTLGALGMADGLWAWIAARPGPTVMAAGAWACIGGLGSLISRWKYVDASTTWWQRVPGQLVGLLVIAIGVGLIGVGRALAADPGHPREVLSRIAERLLNLLAGGG